MPESYAIAKLLASFVIVVIFIYTIYYYLNNYQTKWTKKGQKIEIVETKMIGKGRYLFLARIKDTEMLLSSDESGIKILKEWKSEAKESRSS